MYLKNSLPLNNMYSPVLEPHSPYNKKNSPREKNNPKSPEVLTLAKKIQQDIISKSPTIPQIVVSNNECKSRVIHPYYDFPDINESIFPSTASSSKDDKKNVYVFPPVSSSTTKDDKKNDSEKGTKFEEEAEEAEEEPTTTNDDPPSPSRNIGRVERSFSMPTMLQQKRKSPAFLKPAISTTNVLKVDEDIESTIEHSLGFSSSEKIECLQFIEGNPCFCLYFPTIRLTNSFYISFLRSFSQAWYLHTRFFQSK